MDSRKKKLKKLIDSIEDEATLQVLNDLLQLFVKNQVKSYSTRAHVPGMLMEGVAEYSRTRTLAPQSEDELLADLDSAEADYASGRTSTTQEVLDFVFNSRKK